MRIYADPSFLVAWLYSQDVNNRKARTWFASHQSAVWVLSDWSRFETLNTLRGLSLRPKGPRPEVAEALRRYFNHLLYHGPFEYERVDWSEVIRDSNQISVGFASRLKARSADTVHVAILEQVNPDMFVSGDQDQIAVAAGRGFRAVSFI
jgi:predicted nucleic acid-binding protein